MSGQLTDEDVAVLGTRAAAAVDKLVTRTLSRINFVTPAAPAGVRLDPVHERCLRCGASISGLTDDPGRPRQYCGDACRKAGQRLRERHGPHWWKQQPWYPDWVAAKVAWHEEWEAGRPERERKAAEERAGRDRQRAEREQLVASMPPDVRRAYEQAEAKGRRESLERVALNTLRLKLDTLASEHADLLRATGHQIRLTNESRKIEKLLRAALYAQSETEAMALFAKARALRAAGEDLDEPLTGMDLLRTALGDLGAGVRAHTTTERTN